MARIDNKVAVLSRIRDAKQILFGQFSDTLTKGKKVVEWKKITDFSKAVGLIPKDKDYTYTRDVFWSNIKRATLTKKDNAKKTGSAGGKTKKITPLDELVIDIIGEDSPVVEGLGILDAMPGTSTQNTESFNVPEDHAAAAPCSNISQVTASKKNKRFITKTSKAHEEYQEEQNLKRRKLELQMEFLRLKNHKMKLEIFEMEERLNVSHSEFTCGINSQNTKQDFSHVLSISDDTSEIL